IDSSRLPLRNLFYFNQTASAIPGLIHGANWKKPDEKGEMPPPPHDDTGHTWRHSDAMLFKMIAEGWRHPFNKTERLTMPAFGESLTDQEIGAVIEYLKTLWTDEQREYQQTESQ
ncbi:c-type cytochrome, partial [Neopusillimonas maritima]|uniref:c-type cytochrome n=1 Tax=Neopusillimonas maritima TaxID=2026239 RepID=UPI001C599ED5